MRPIGTSPSRPDPWELADEVVPEKAKHLASRLIDVAAEIAQSERRCRAQDWDMDGNYKLLSDQLNDAATEWHGIRYVVEVADALEKTLEEAGFSFEQQALEQNALLGLGTVTWSGEMRPIYAGFVQPILRLPIVKRLGNRVLFFLISIPGFREFLSRENHSSIGYHYHYLDARQRRSNVAICWDTRAHPQTPHPLFQEKHGEAHSRIAGRPDLWGATKCESIHAVCAKDLNRWTLDKFRMASNGAQPVWPLGAVLTDKPTPI